MHTLRAGAAINICCDVYIIVHVYIHVCTCMYIYMYMYF